MTGISVRMGLPFGTAGVVGAMVLHDFLEEGCTGRVAGDGVTTNPEIR